MAPEGGRDLRVLLERRQDVLALLEAAPRTQAEVAEALDISRSTVTRATSELEAHDLVRRREGRLETTAVGAALLASHDRYARTVDAVAAARSVLQYLPADAPFDPSILVDGSLHTLDPGSGFEVRERVNEAFRSATGVTGLGRTWSEREAGPIFRELALEQGYPTETVMSRALFDHVREQDWAPAMFRADNVEVRVTESVPYGLFVLDQPETEVMVLVIYDGDGAMKGIVQSESPRAIDWARSVYVTYRERAVPWAEYIS